MQQANEAWISLIHRIPGNLHETVVLGMRTGIELVMQKLLRLEPDFILMRGRVSGTQDNARILMVPYCELSYVALTRALKDPEVEAIFGKSTPPHVAEMPIAGSPAAEEPAPTAADEEETADEQEVEHVE